MAGWKITMAKWKLVNAWWRELTSDTWYLEYTAVVTSFASLAAIVGFLAYYNGEPWFHWHSITVNAIISLLATVAQGVAAFSVGSCFGQYRWIWFRRENPLSDIQLVGQASRGPGGVLHLLLRTRGLSLISIGCWVTITAQLMSFSMQQIILPHQKTIYKETQTARAPFASRWSAAAIQNSFLGFWYTPVTDASDVHIGLEPHVDFTTQAAIRNSFNTSSEDILRDLKLACDTGTCRWDNYQSLAVCSSCSDISDAIVSYLGSDVDEAYLFRDPHGVKGPVNLTTYYIPKTGLFINNPINYTFSNGSTERLTMTALANWNAGYSITFQNSSTLLFSFQAIWSDLDDDNRYSDWAKAKVLATECGLYLCIKEFNTTINNSSVSETSREIASTREINSYQIIGDSPETTLVIRNLQNYSVEMTDLQIKTPRGFLPDHNDAVNISQAGVCGLSYYLNKAFDGGLGQNWQQDGEWKFDLTIPHVSALVRLLPDHNEFQYLPDVMQVLWADRASGFRNIFDRLATSLTNNIRMTADGGVSVTGLKGTQTSIIYVRWVWITLPCATVVLGAIFLFIVRIETRKTGTPIWKVSDLALLFSRLDQELREQLARKRLQSEMEEAAEGTSVRFSKSAYVLQKSNSGAGRGRSDYTLIDHVPGEAEETKSDSGENTDTAPSIEEFC